MNITIEYSNIENIIKKSKRNDTFCPASAYHNVYFYETTRHSIANILVHQILFIFDAISNKEAERTI